MDIEMIAEANFNSHGTYIVDTESEPLNLRAGASISAEILGTLPKGTEIKATGLSVGLWILVITQDDKVGFVHSYYVVKKL